MWVGSPITTPMLDAHRGRTRRVFDSISRSVSAEARLRVAPTPALAELQIEPAYAFVSTGTSLDLTVNARDQYGDLIASGSPTWSVFEGDATIDADGRLTAGSSEGLVTVEVEVGGISGVAFLSVYTAVPLIPTGVEASASLAANVAGRAIDGSTTTRWESPHGEDNHTLTLDFGLPQRLASTTINWETAAASHYRLDGSLDGLNWETLSEVTGGSGGIETIALNGHARYLRLTCLARTTIYGYSIWEWNVMGYDSLDPETTTSLELIGIPATAATGIFVPCSAFATDAYGRSARVNPIWSIDLGSIDAEGEWNTGQVSGVAHLSAIYEGQETTATITVLSRHNSEPFKQWILAAYGLEVSDTVLADFAESDVDLNGLPELLDFYAGTDSTHPSFSMGIEAVGGSSDALVLRILRSVSAAASISLRFETSVDLDTWTPLIPELLGVTPGDDSHEMLELQFNGDGEPIFIRPVLDLE